MVLDVSKTLVVSDASCSGTDRSPSVVLEEHVGGGSTDQRGGTFELEGDGVPLGSGLPRVLTRKLDTEDSGSTGGGKKRMTVLEATAQRVKTQRERKKRWKACEGVVKKAEVITKKRKEDFNGGFLTPSVIHGAHRTTVEAERRNRNNRFDRETESLHHGERERSRFIDDRFANDRDEHERSLRRSDDEADRRRTRREDRDREEHEANLRRKD